MTGRRPPRRRSRPRRGSRGPSRRRLGLILAVLVLAVAATAPLLAFTSTNLSRASAIAVVDDSQGATRLDVASSVRKNRTDRLVTVTPFLDHDAVSLTVTLEDPSQGTLSVGGVASGSSATVTRDNGQSARFDLLTREPPGTVVPFTVRATAPGIAFLASRSTTVAPPGAGTPTPRPPPSATRTATPSPVPGNQPPTASFTAVRKGNSKNVDLDASASSDPDGTIVSYEWDLDGDGIYDRTGVTVTNAPVASGETVTLRVTDDDGARATASQVVP